MINLLCAKVTHTHKFHSHQIRCCTNACPVLHPPLSMDPNNIRAAALNASCFPHAAVGFVQACSGKHTDMSHRLTATLSDKHTTAQADRIEQLLVCYPAAAAAAGRGTCYYQPELVLYWASSQIDLLLVIQPRRHIKHRSKSWT